VTLLSASPLLLLVGCGGAPPVERPDLRAELPETWTRDVPEAAPEPWWASFDDPHLRAVVDEALLHNLDLQAAAARLEAAGAEARIAGADIWPQVSAGGSAVRQQQVFTFFPGGLLKNLNNTYGVSLDVSWEVDLWGRLRTQRSAAAADLQAAVADYRGARLSIAAQAMKAWFAAVEAQRQLDLAEETATSFAGTTRTIRDRYETGVRSSLDLRLAMVDEANARTELEARRQAADRAVRQLEILLGRYPSRTMDVGADLAEPLSDVPAGLPADLLARRPDLVAAERRLAASDRRHSQSKRALLPRLTLTASGGRTGAELEDLLDGDFTVWSLAAGLLQPIFQGGRLRAQVARAGALSDAAVAEYANRVLEACAEVETLLTAERSLREQEAAQALAAEQAAAARDLARDRYESGLDDVIPLLSAQRAAAQAQARLLDVRRRRLDARVDLHLALGGDFDPARPDDPEKEESAS
jgi:NodT family efflux transporter outer membrane factor (OMF) lipoprotein